jgi:hypothetical protein
MGKAAEERQNRVAQRYQLGGRFAGHRRRDVEMVEPQGHHSGWLEGISHEAESAGKGKPGNRGQKDLAFSISAPFLAGRSKRVGPARQAKGCLFDFAFRFILWRLRLRSGHSNLK